MVFFALDTICVSKASRGKARPHEGTAQRRVSSLKKHALHLDEFFANIRLSPQSLPHEEQRSLQPVPRRTTIPARRMFSGNDNSSFSTLHTVQVYAFDESRHFRQKNATSHSGSSTRVPSDMRTDAPHASQSHILKRPFCTQGLHSELPSAERRPSRIRPHWVHFRESPTVSA